MAIGVRCPACEKNLNVRDDLAGQRVKCPSCGQVIKVLAPRPESSAKPTNLSPLKSPAAGKGSPMASSTPVSSRGRLRWPWVVGGTVLVAVVIGLGAFLGSWQRQLDDKYGDRPAAAAPPGNPSPEKEKDKNEAKTEEPGKSLAEEPEKPTPIKWAAPAPGDKVAAVGKGSYAAGPTPEAGDAIKKFELRDLYLVHEDDRPIPTNQWWTDLIVSKYARSLWASPLKIDTSRAGIGRLLPHAVGRRRQRPGQ